MMKKNKDISIYENLDGELFFDINKGKFTMNFDDDQMQLLEYGLEHNMPVQAIAYPFVSAQCMHDIMEFMSENQGTLEIHNMKRIDYWKTAMMYHHNPAECKSVLSAMEYGVNVFEEFPNVKILDSQTLELISIAASCGENVCKKVRSGLLGQNLANYIERTIDKNAKRKRRRDFLYTLRYPGAKSTGLFE